MKPLQKYFIAGLDFIVDRDDKIFFIEANSTPGLFRSVQKRCGKCYPLLDIKKKFSSEKNKQNFLFVYNPKTGKEVESRYKIKKFKKTFGAKQCKLLILPDLKDTTIVQFIEDYKKINPRPIVYTPFIKIKEQMWKNGLHDLFNPLPVTKICIDKNQLYSKLKPTKNFFVPRFYPFQTKSELKKIIEKSDFEKFVIKPKSGQKGRNIYFLNDPKKINILKLPKEEWIVQEKIEVKKINNKFWDVRAFLIDGKYSAAVGRKSTKPIVNVSAGGRTFKLPIDLEKRIAKAAEDVVKQINKLIK